jgi:hypothetical protein
MLVLCSSCGFHHEVVRVLEDGIGDERKDVYQIAPLEECARTWLSDREILEAHARFGQEAIVSEEDDE